MEQTSHDPLFLTNPHGTYTYQLRDPEGPK